MRKRSASDGGAVLRGLLAALVILLLIMHSRSVSAQAVNLIGVVAGPNDEPLSGAIVEVYGSDGSFVGLTTSLPNGYFSITLPDKGTYDIVVYKRGYERRVLRWSILNGGTVNIGRLTLNYALSVVADATYVVAGQGEMFQIPVVVTNLGAYLESINVSVVAPPGWSASLVSEQEFVVKGVMLPPGASRRFVLRVRVPGSALGQARLEVRFSYANVSQSLPITVEVVAKEWGLVQVMYPEVFSFAGDLVQVPVLLRNTLSVPLTMNVSVSAPRGWIAFLAVNGTQVMSLHLDPGSSAPLLLTVKVPESAAPGRYRLFLSAHALDISSNASLIVNVVAGYDSLVLGVPTPIVYTQPGASASIAVTVTNEGTRAALVTFEVRGIPPGFNWVLEDEQGNLITAVYVKPRDSLKVILRIEVPSTAAPTAFNFSLTAYGANSKASVELGMIVRGKPSLRVLTQNWEVTVSAGSSTVFHIEVKNDGQVPLEDLRVVPGGDLPPGIQVSVEPQRVANLPPADVATFTLTIAVNDKVAPGRYFIPVVISGGGVRAERVLAANVRAGGGVFFFVAALAITVLVVAALVTRWRYHRVRRSG